MTLKLYRNSGVAAQIAELSTLFPSPSERLGLPAAPNRFTPPRIDSRELKHQIRTMVGAPFIDGREFDMENAEHVWLPLGTGDSLATTATKNYELKPTRNFLPTYFQFHSAAIAEALHMTNFQIGGKNTFIGAGAVGCGGFSPLSEPKLFRASVSNNGKPMTFTLTNFSGGTVVVYGYVGGLAEPE